MGILSYSVETNVPSDIHWVMDTLSNNVAVIEFAEPTQALGWAPVATMPG